MDAMLCKYNQMLKDEYGEHITVEIKGRVEDDGSTWYYYTSARYGDSDDFESLANAYSDACIYLSYVGELW